MSLVNGVVPPGRDAGRPASRRAARPFGPGRRGLAAALAVVFLAACGGPERLSYGLPTAAPDTGNIRDVLDDATEADGDSLLVRRLRASRLTPAFGERFRLASGATVAFIPGRHPRDGDELVVAAAEGGTPGAAALLEEARLLNARAAYTTAPSRTVLVAVLPRGSGARGLAAVLDAPVWTRALTVVALVAGGGGGEAPGAYEAAGAERGVPVEVLAAPAGQEPVTEALALAASLRAALDRWATPDPRAAGGE